MIHADTKSLYDTYVVPSYGRLPLAFARGKGAWLYDEDATPYLDMYPGWGVNLLGHCHPKVVAAIRDQARTLLHAPNNYHGPLQAALAKAIIDRAFPGKVFFSNSGAEANEAALKLARKWGSDKGKWKFITMHNSFHGRTYGALSATAQEKYHNGFGPMLPGFTYVPFGDSAAVRQAIDSETCAVLIEPIQGEGGVNVAPAGYFKDLRAACDAAGCLLMFDEVQTGVGRTGEWFGFQWVGVTPDVMTLAKALGGGVPIGAMVVGTKVCDVLQPGTHASTYGGNALVCAAGLAVFDVLEQKKGLAKAKKVGKLLQKRAKDLRATYPVIKDIRGAGAMLGIELDKPGQPVVNECLERKVLVNCTHDTVLRFLTSIFLKADEIDQAFAAVEAGLKKL
jgi:predicted acetylornithine/succinylornithine family transaminase